LVAGNRERSVNTCPPDNIKRSLNEFLREELFFGREGVFFEREEVFFRKEGSLYKGITGLIKGKNHFIIVILRIYYKKGRKKEED